MRRRRSVGTGGAAALRFRFPASESSPSTIERANRPPSYGAGRRVSVAGRNDDSGRSPFSLRGDGFFLFRGEAPLSLRNGMPSPIRRKALFCWRGAARRGRGFEVRSGRQRGLLPATAVKCSRTHSIRLSRIGIRLRPSSVSEYSTLGGTSAYSCRQGLRCRFFTATGPTGSTT